MSGRHWELDFRSLLANLQSRGLRTDRSLLVILDGALALHKAVRAVFGAAALMQRCQVHTRRNILDHLPERQRPWVQAIVRRAYQASDVKTATRLLSDLANRLEDEYPSAAGSVREGLDETLTVLTLHLSTRLQRSLATTNAAESLLSRTRHVKRNVKRWRGGQMTTVTRYLLDKHWPFAGPTYQDVRSTVRAGSGPVPDRIVSNVQT